MDQTEARIVMTIISFITFAGIVLWAYGRGRKQAFDEAAALPFMEEDQPGKAGETRQP